MNNKDLIFCFDNTARNLDLVLIGVVKRKTDLIHVIKDHWYRIPARFTFQQSPRYLAVYSSNICRRGKGGISFYSLIREVTRVKRIELLPEENLHPKANDLYWKLKLGPPEKLPHLIENRLRRRITFAYTTREKLFIARELGELFGIPPLEEILRKYLDREGISYIYQYCLIHDNKCRYRLDFALPCRKGKIALECDHSRWHQRAARQKKDHERDFWLTKHGWTMIHLSEEEIINKPDQSMKNIINQIRALGGNIPDIN